MSLLKAQPGEKVMVEAPYSESPEEAVADEDGTLRDSEGRAYSAGVYEVVGDE